MAPHRPADYLGALVGYLAASQPQVNAAIRYFGVISMI
jgi:hypothetical protein